jgi:hypothetical protein
VTLPVARAPSALFAALPPDDPLLPHASITSVTLTAATPTALKRASVLM